MTITIRLTKVEYEMLKELQKRDKRYKKGLEGRSSQISRQTTRQQFWCNWTYDII